MLALANSDELDRSAASRVTDDLCSCKWAISVPLMPPFDGMTEARFVTAKSVVDFSIKYSRFRFVCSEFSSFLQSDVRSANGA